MCNGNHGVWRCEKFKDLGIQERWDTAKRLNLYFRCLGADHRGLTCVRSRICGINSCRETHNRLLHVYKDQRQQFPAEPTPNRNEAALSSPNTRNEPKLEDKKVPLVLLPPREASDQQAKWSHPTATSDDTQTGFLALWTIPVILKNVNREVQVKALLNEASTKTYINADVASELWLEGMPRKVTVNILKGQTETFETMPVDFELVFLDGSMKRTVSAFTTENGTGRLEAIDCRRHADKWSHL